MLKMASHSKCFDSSISKLNNETLVTPPQIRKGLQSQQHTKARACECSQVTQKRKQLQSQTKVDIYYNFTSLQKWIFITSLQAWRAQPQSKCLLLLDERVTMTLSRHVLVRTCVTKWNSNSLA
jgi:hypothetical protein